MDYSSIDPSKELLQLQLLKFPVYTESDVDKTYQVFADYMLPETLEAEINLSELKLVNFTDYEKFLDWYEMQQCEFSEETQWQGIEDRLRSLNQSVEDLNTKKLDELQLGIEKQARITAKGRREVFENGETLKQASRWISPLPEPSIHIYPDDFSKSGRGQFMKSYGSERDWSLRARLSQKLHTRKSQEKQLSLIMRLHALSQTHFEKNRNLALLFTKIAKEKNLPLDTIDTSNLEEDHSTLLKNFIDSITEKQQERSDSALLETWTDEPVIKTAQKKHKKKKSTRKDPIEKKPTGKSHTKTIQKVHQPLTPPICEFGQAIIDANTSATSASTITPNSHVSRWDSAKLEDIKTFQDKDLRTGELVQHYAERSDKNLKQMRRNHKLSGLAKLLSIDHFKNHYTLGYTFCDTTGSERPGHSLFAMRQINRGEPELVVISVGIGTNNIMYHAMAKPASKKRELEPSDLCPSFDTEAIQEIMDWEQVSEYTYEWNSQTEDVTMIVQDEQNKIAYTFQK